jgi:hypothetical protein
MVSIKLCRKPEYCIFCKERAIALIAENPVCLKHLKKISTDLQLSEECKEFVHNYLQERARNDLYNLGNSSFKHERARKRSDLSSYLIKKYTDKKPKFFTSHPLKHEKRENPDSVLESL